MLAETNPRSLNNKNAAFYSNFSYKFVYVSGLLCINHSVVRC